MINRFFPEMNPEYRRGELLVFVKVVPGKPNEYFLAYGSTAPNTFRTELPPGKRVINGRIEDAPIPAVEPEKKAMIQEMVPVVLGVSFEELLEAYQQEGDHLTADDLCADILNQGEDQFGDVGEIDEIIMNGIIAIAEPLGLV